MRPIDNLTVYNLYVLIPYVADCNIVPPTVRQQHEDIQELFEEIECLKFELR